MARVVPVVRDLAPVVVAHDVRLVRHVRALRVVEVDLAKARPAELGLIDEAVHPSAGHVRQRGLVAVRAARIAILGVVIGAVAAAAIGIRDARQRARVPGEPCRLRNAELTGRRMNLRRRHRLRNRRGVGSRFEPPCPSQREGVC